MFSNIIQTQQHKLVISYQLNGWEQIPLEDVYIMRTYKDIQTEGLQSLNTRGSPIPVTHDQNPL